MWNKKKLTLFVFFDFNQNAVQSDFTKKLEMTGKVFSIEFNNWSWYSPRSDICVQRDTASSQPGLKNESQTSLDGTMIHLFSAVVVLQIHKWTHKWTQPKPLAPHNNHVNTKRFTLTSVKTLMQIESILHIIYHHIFLYVCEYVSAFHTCQHI